MKGLIILLFVLLVSTTVSSKVIVRHDNVNQNLVLCQNDSGTLLRLGDVELSFEDEDDNQVFLLSNFFAANFRSGEILFLNSISAFVSLQGQISPHQYTNLPPPLSHLIL